MVSADVLKEIWEDIVTRHITDVAFSSEWSAVLDQNTEVEYPACLWLTFGPSSITPAADVLMWGHTVSMMFVDKVRNDRDADERDAVVSKMGITAAHCFARFHRDYIQRDDSTWQGEKVSLELASPPVITSVFDTTGLNLSGVTMTFTVQSLFAMECTNTMFN